MKTLVTELLGCRYPILQGAMAGLGNWEFAAAVANAGGHGTITASVCRTPERLREDIRHCRAATSGSFGVNLSFGICPRIEEMLEVCIAESVPVETAMYKPDSVAARIKQSGIRWIHKSARVKDAVHAEALGVDAVIIVGLEGTGFKSPEQLPIMPAILLAKRQLTVPVIAAGGLSSPASIISALALGAEGIMMGTAFMLTKECPLKGELKERILKTSADDPRLLKRVLGSVDPKAYAEVMAMRGKVPLEQWLLALERVNLKDEQPVQGHSQNRTEEVVTASDPTRMVSLALAGIERLQTVKELVDGIVQGVEVGMGRLRTIAESS